MITREQAEAAILADNASDEHVERECRVLKMMEVYTLGIGVNVLGIVEAEPQGWQVTYEFRDHSKQHENPQWSEWYKVTEYVVEARPGPYVVS